MHQQIMIAQSIVSGGGGGGSPPTSLVGLTYWYDGDDDGLSFINADGTSVAADGDPVRLNISAGGIGRRLVDEAGRMTRRKPVRAPSGGMFSSYDSGSSPANFQGNSTGAPSTFNQIFSAGTSLVIAAIRIDNASPTTGADWTEGALVSDANYGGLQFVRVGTEVLIRGYNYASAGVQTVTVTRPFGEWIVLTWDRRAGRNRLRINGVQVADVASGNTAVTSSFMTFGALSDLSIAQFCTARSANTPAAILEVERWMAAKIGVTIP